MFLRALSRLRRQLLALSFAFLMPLGAAAQTGGCVSGLSATDMFAWAEANFPSLFPQVPARGRIANYDYRFYAGTNLYLAVQDGTCAVLALGAITGWNLVNLGTLAQFAPAITSWRSSTATICTYTVTPTSLTMDAAGGTGTVNVRQVQTACTVPNPPWSASSQTSWISNARAGALSNGQGPAYFDVAANSGTSSRQGTVVVAGVTITVTQPAGSSSLAGTYSGRWSGSCELYGVISGTFTMTVASSGAVTGSYRGSDSGSFSGSVDAAGSFSSASGVVSGGAMWSGTIRAGGTGSGGSWTTAGCSGGWSIP